MRAHTCIFAFLFFAGLLTSPVYTDEPLRIKMSDIKSIAFATRSYDWSAYCTYYSDCTVYGAHLSGQPPFVHEERGTIARKDLREILQAAVPVLLVSYPKDPQSDPAWNIYESITIVHGDTVTQILWQANPVFQDPGESVLHLKEAILKHRIGGW